MYLMYCSVLLVSHGLGEDGELGFPVFILIPTSKSPVDPRCYFSRALQLPQRECGVRLLSSFTYSVDMHSI
ncbi:hypothetical protein BGX38DRAFT_1203777 [Terfezia claveryi]|nr:hypothetical protein BGX38DRAFT_1203777 [Terfezia claveryi]